MTAMREAIDDDLRRGVVAAWHDESHWNRYLVDHPADVVLPPEYCCPESWPLPGRKLLALEKDHAALRG
jgi:histo-blood group ABO system transferase